MSRTLAVAFTSFLAAAILVVSPKPATGYVEAPMSLGAVVAQSTNIVAVTVKEVDKTKNLIIYQKVRDIKGKHPQELIKHNIGRGGLRPGEWEEIMKWAEVGKTAVFFHNGGASETFIGVTWYQAYPGGEWWNMSHGEPFLLRSYAGKTDKLPGFIDDILAGKEVIVPCMVDGDKEAIHKKTAKIQRLKASLKIQDYNPKRDFVGWGGEDIRRLAGMPGFDRFAALPRTELDAQGVTIIDFDADGKPDVCLCGASRVVLLQNGGDNFSEVSLPGFVGGARSAVWADCNSDGLPDLLLATPTGPRLFINLGRSQFKDASHRLPQEAAYNPTAAAWGDFDGDGKPDVLLANGYHGLRFYRNIRTDTAPKYTPPKLGDWNVIGMFRAPEPSKNFETPFAVETEKFNPSKEYKGKRDMPVKWEKKAYKDGEPNQIPEVGNNCATYLYRELEMTSAADVPCSIGSGNTLTVWLNGERIHSQPTAKPEPAQLTLKLNAGKNTLLIKMCNTDQPQSFTFSIGPNSDGPPGPWFEDVSTAWGLGTTGIAADLKGDTLAVADFNGDGRPDFLYGAGSGVFVLNHGQRFAVRPDSGISYKPGKIGPALCDYDNDGHVDLFIPQIDGACRLFKNTGNGSFTAVASAGDLSKPIPGAVAATWGDYDNDGQPDLLVCVLRGPNRYFKNNGDGTFTDKTSELGLTQRVFNSQGAALVDLNGDGQLDLVLNNEGQESAILFGTMGTPGGKMPLVVNIHGTTAINGGKIIVKDMTGKPVAVTSVYGGDGRGGQSGFSPRFCLTPGQYKVEIISTDGRSKVADVTLANSPMNLKLQ